MNLQELRQLADSRGLALYRFKMPKGEFFYPLFFVKTATGKLLNNGDSLDMNEAIEFVERNQGTKKKPARA